MPTRIAVVGHTNTGKTSLLRTLTRDSGFGEVASRPGTTRHVEGARLLADGQVRVELFDTPGLEDPIALLERVEALAAGERLDGPARIARFLAAPEAAGRFDQEAKVLRQMLASDAAFYVIDARDPVLAKHRDELALLAACGIPLLPVLNFVRDPAAEEAPWRETLARHGLHASVRFDTVAPERDAERRLYEALGTLLDAHRPGLQALVDAREREAAARRDAACRGIAELLVDVAAARRSALAEPPQAMRAAVEALSDAVRRREQACVDELLALYRFDATAIDAAPLPLLDGRWETDLFQPEALRQMGLKLGGGAAAGAAAGVGIDLMVGGITLGAAAALGALAGGGWQTVRHYGRRLKSRLTGQHELSVDEPILRLLALRQRALLHALEARGHAAVAPSRIDNGDTDPWRDDRLPMPLRQARAHPHWSRLSDRSEDSPARREAIQSLAASLSDRP